jgi:hypothetical protein
MAVASPARGEEFPPRAEADMARCESPPRIDGDLSDACWGKATHLGAFRKLGGAETDSGQVRFCADDQWLYASYDVNLPLAQKMQFTVHDHDGSISADDSVELFLDPGTGGRIYYHFMLSAANVQGERKCYANGNKDYAWGIPWRSATRAKEKSWQAEIAIPLSFLANEPNWKGMTLNLCITRVLVTLNQAGERISLTRDFGSWSAVRNTFHEPNRFGIVRKMDGFTLKEAFLPMAEQIRVGKYEPLEKGGFGYRVSGILRNTSDLTGRVTLVARDKPEGGAESLTKQAFDLKAAEGVPFALAVPVTDLGARSGTLEVRDAAGDEVFLSYDLREAGELRLLRAYPRLSYFTTEKAAEIVCEFGLREDGLKKLRISARNGVGEDLARARAETGGLDVPMKRLAPGPNWVTVTLSQADGKELARQTVTLVKRAPKPGSECKIDLADKILLDNGKRFFPFGIMFNVGGTGDALDAAMKDVADAGFNTVVRWCGVEFADRAALYDAAGKYGIKVVDALYDYRNKAVTKEQLEPRPDMSPAEKMALVQDLVWLPAAMSLKDRPNLLAWYLWDEPGTDLEQAANNLRLYRKVYEQDGYHPAEILQIPPMPEGEAYSSNCDIYGIDPYWIPGAGTQGDIGSPHRVGFHTWVLRRKADRDLKLAWITPCAELWSGINMRIILEKEQHAQSYLSLIQGAKGLLYFTYPFRYQGSHDGFRKLGVEMKRLAPACATPEVEQQTAYSPVVWDPRNGYYPDVQVSLKREPSGGYLLLAANWKPYPVEIRVEMPALGALKKLPHAFDATRTYAVAAGAFADTLEPMGTRAYAIGVKKLSEPVTIRVDLKKRPEQTDPLYAALAEDNPRRGVKNAFANSGFDQDSAPGMPDYYTYYLLGARRVGGASGIGVTTDRPYEGKKCMRLAPGVMISYTIRGPLKLDVNAPAVFSLYARTDDEKGGDINITAPDTNGKWNADGQRSGANAKLTTEWQRIVLPVSVPAASPPWGWHFWAYGRCSADKGIYLDALQLELGTEATEYVR